MTLTEFFHHLLMTYPKAEYRLRIEASYKRTPAHTRTLLGEKTSYRETEDAKASYQLTFTPNFFLKSHEDESFEAPSLQALWETLKATYLTEGKGTVEEIEDWLAKKEASHGQV